jgi:hypothetical protein
MTVWSQRLPSMVAVSESGDDRSRTTGLAGRPRHRSRRVPDIASIVQIVLASLGIAVPSFLFFVLLRGDGTWSLANIFSAPDFNAWPRGVQEEEPFRRGTAVADSIDAGADVQAGPAATRTAPWQLRPAGSDRRDDPIAEVA